MDRFIEDYKFTACSGLVRWFYDKHVRGEVVTVAYSDGPEAPQSGSFAQVYVISSTPSFSTDALPPPSPLRQRLSNASGGRYPQSTPATPSPASSSGGGGPSLPYALLLAFSLAHCSQKMGLEGAGAILVPDPAATMDSGSKVEFSCTCFYDSSFT